jgi:hypothetical protein
MWNMAHNTMTVTDFSEENSSFGFESAALTAGNIVAQTAAAGTLEAATEALTIGNIAKNQVSQILLDDPGVPTNPYAQRELKWLVRYENSTTGKKFSLEIPAPNLTDNIVAGTDVADLASTDWAAWKTAFEAYAKPEDNLSNAVTVLGATVVGRNI